MKKSIFIGALALIMVTACQNEREEITKKDPEKAINAVKFDAKGSASRMGEGASTSLEDIGPNDAFISCHTPYAEKSGNSCVWVNGQQFNVKWITHKTLTDTGFYNERIYTATATSFCNCG